MPIRRFSLLPPPPHFCRGSSFLMADGGGAVMRCYVAWLAVPGMPACVFFYVSAPFLSAWFVFYPTGMGFAHPPSFTFIPALPLRGRNSSFLMAGWLAPCGVAGGAGHACLRVCFLCPIRAIPVLFLAGEPGRDAPVSLGIASTPFVLIHSFLHPVGMGCAHLFSDVFLFCFMQVAFDFSIGRTLPIGTDRPFFSLVYPPLPSFFSSADGITG